MALRFLNMRKNLFSSEGRATSVPSKSKNAATPPPFSLISFLSASCATLFAPPTGPAFPAMYFHPSTSTGNPRSKQNAAVIHVNTYAPTRIMAWTSAAS